MPERARPGKGIVPLTPRPGTARTGTIGQGGEGETRVRGPALLVAGIALFGLLDANSKLLSGQYGVGQGVFLRYVVLVLAFLAARALRPGAGGELRTAHPGLHFARACSMMVSAGGFFLGLRELSLAEGYLVFFTAPLWTLLLAATVLREPVPRIAWVWSAVGFGGVLLAVAPKLAGDGAGSAFGYLAVLASTIAYATTLTINRQLRGEVGPARVLLWPTLMGLALYGPLAALDWTPPPDAADWVKLSVNGLFAGAAVVCTAAAFRHADSARLAPFGFAGLPVSLALDLAIWGKWPELMTVLGGAVVVFACLMSERAQRRMRAVMEAG
jgi:drug/metabolite transporter (DMT)-like permease